MDAQTKTTHRHEPRDGILGAVSSMRGRRFTMEDEHIIHMNFLGRYSLFAVFDGHGGEATAKYCQTHFSNHLTEKMKDIDFSNNDLITATLKQSFIEFDQSICKMLDDNKNESGTTAVCAIVTDDKIIVANCGDSRSVLGAAGTTIAMSLDHKPTQKLEKARIKDAGGIVVLGRVNGDLAVSRALGDLSYKDKTKDPDKELVSCIPDVTIHSRQETDEVLLLACDGVWDVMRSEEAVEFSKHQYRTQTKDIGTICEEILRECFEKGSSDNMTLICVKFPGLDIELKNEEKNEEGKEERKEETALTNEELNQAPPTIGTEGEQIQTPVNLNQESQTNPSSVNPNLT